MSHQKKLSRLKEISSILELLKIIGYKNFIHAIIEKYPFPPIAGFSSHRWTEELFYKYIYLYLYNYPSNFPILQAFPPVH